MKRSKPYLLITLSLLPGCSMFQSVDPLPPAFSKVEILEVTATSVTLSGSISHPDFTNSRQEKKSGIIKEYGLVYVTSAALGVESGNVIKLGDTPAQMPVAIESKTFSIPVSDQTYYVALYARNEGGGMAYSEAKEVKPPVIVKGGSTISVGSASQYFDLDAVKLRETNDATADVQFSLFTITGRGTVVTVKPVNSTVLQNLGIVDYASLALPYLAKLPDYSTKEVSYLFNTGTANTVIAYKTSDGNFGKLVISNVTQSAITYQLATYKN